MVYQFNKVYEEYFGKKASFQEVKKQYNDLVLSMEDFIRREIVNAKDPLAKAFLYARVGNYIDFRACTVKELGMINGPGAVRGMKC